jgi:hypothetical protein
MAAWTFSGVRTLPGCGRLCSVLRPAPFGLDAEDDGQPLSTGAAGPELDEGHDGDGHQQPWREQDVQDEADDGQDHDGGED